MVEVDEIVSMLLDRDSCPITCLHTFAFEEGFVDSEDRYRALLHEVAIRLAREEVMLKSDRYGIEIYGIEIAIKMLDDLNPTLNLLSERLFEWYSLYEEGILPSEGAASEIMKRHDIPHAMRILAQNLTDLYESRGILIEHIQDEAILIAPNLTNLAGALLVARLISIAGGLERLARMPASRLQVLGANRAMFRHLRGASPPKHGVIFQHPLVHASPRRLRGRIARTFASKLAIAARIDYYSGEVREGLAESLAGRIEGICRCNY
jgi:nucleolar protein 56